MKILSAQVAQDLAMSAISLATEASVAISVAVVDDGGHLIAMLRMDGAPWPTSSIAAGKAWTAAAWGAPSADQGAKARTLPEFSAALSSALPGNYIPQDGGVPIVIGGDVAGGIGASGSTGDHDAEMVTNAVRQIIGESI